VTTFGTGFKPNSQVDVYLYSIATWLGSVITDDKGNYTVTLPMPLTLPVGDHTFQARGVTFDNLERTANVPITLVPASDAPALTTKAAKKFEVFYAMNSVTLDAKAKKVIRKAFTQVKSRLTSASTVKVQITGWVQPTNRSPRIQFLSTNRATAVRNYLKELGLKAKFTIAAPGHDKRNVPTSRRASALIEWNNAKK
jgi:outer membrane protein OmpA-like peptidoglycan-associated protein